MDKKMIDYTLYLVTDRELMSCDTIEESVERAIAGGASVVQLREKNATSREFYELAVRVKKITAPRGVPLIINDRIDICLAADTNGVHLGQKDIPCDIARRILGSEKIIGVSAATPEEAAKAERDGVVEVVIVVVRPAVLNAVRHFADDGLAVERIEVVDKTCKTAHGRRLLIS